MAIRYVFNPLEGTFDAIDKATIPDSTITCDCTASEAVGDWVVIVNSPPPVNDYLVRTIDVTSDTDPAIGVIESKTGDEQCVVRTSGITSIYTGLTPGTAYMIDYDGQLTATLSDPPSGFQFVQAIGAALTSDELLIMHMFRYKRVF